MPLATDVPGVNVRKSIIAAIAAAVLLTVSACGGSSGGGGTSGSETSSGGTLTLAAVTPPKSFAVGEMASNGPENHYYQAVYDTLLSLDKDGKPAANLATEWSYDATNTTLSLTLRDDVKFTDGTPFDAAAVKANLEKAKQSTGEAGSALRAVDSVTVVDATHADIVLSAPDPSLVDSLARSSGYMASPKALGNADLATNPVGSGPYVYDEGKSTAGSTYVFTRNADYWNKAAYPYDSVEIKYLDDTTATLNGLRSGQIQGASGASSDLVTGAKQAGLTVTEFPSGGVEGVWLWDRDGANTPALANEKVRQAINYAFDRKTIVDKIKGGLGTPDRADLRTEHQRLRSGAGGQLPLRPGQGQVADGRGRLRGRVQHDVAGLLPGVPGRAGCDDRSPCGIEDLGHLLAHHRRSGGRQHHGRPVADQLLLADVGLGLGNGPADTDPAIAVQPLPHRRPDGVGPARQGPDAPLPRIRARSCRNSMPTWWNTPGSPRGTRRLAST